MFGAPATSLHQLAEVAVNAQSEVDLYDKLVSLWRTSTPVVLGTSGPRASLIDETLRASIPDFTECMMYLDQVTYLPDDILTKVDRASMSVGLEARCPLLDHRVIEWAAALPMRFKQRDGKTKWLLRQLLYRYVPPALVERPKTGFSVPIGEWMRGPLRDWAEALLDERRLRDDGWFDVTAVRRAWREHVDGTRNHEYRLWVILMFQAWQSRWRKPGGVPQ